MTVLTNALIVTPQAVVHGTLVIEGSTIVDIQPGGTQSPGAIDCGRDYLIPGIVDLHTDNLERQVQPRSNARWPSRSAMVAHDVQCAAAGVTTVLDALCLGDLGFEAERVQTFRDALTDLDALVDTGLLKADHYLHLRCELPAENMPELLETSVGHQATRMISLMNHSPGVGQYADLDRYRAMRRKDGHSAEKIEAMIVKLQAKSAEWGARNRRALLERVAGLGIVLASHDDRTEAEVDTNHRDGIRISEFPVTVEAAKAAKARGMEVIAGAPNIVRGGSHSGNVAAAHLVREGAVDALASDYVPASLIEAAFRVTGETGLTLPEAVGLVSDRPARMAGFTDRGRLEAGLRADLVQLRLHHELPVVRQVWRAGERVI